MQVRGTKGTLELSKDNLISSIKKVRGSKKDNTLEEMSKFLQKSALDDALLENNKLILKGDSTILETNILGFGKVEKVFSELSLLNEAIQIDFLTTSKCRQIERMLGENWSVNMIKGSFVLQRSDMDECLVLSY